jgi:aspartyl-tRNA(Asn)/glutamyl-tRNA(Gln) amidotransferase subunit A
MTDLTKNSLTQSVNLIRKKEIKSEELTLAYIQNINKGKKLNSFITECLELALAKAKNFDLKPNYNFLLPGIPIAVKDLFCTSGIKTTAASKMLANFVPNYESTVTNNLWSQGAFLLGKLNCDEYAMGSSNETSFFGNVINPVKENTVPGGSSGGSACALAADLTPATIGTDTGGSIRQPASFTGTVGLKPTYGLCSRWGIVAFASSLDQAGPMTKTVSDCALMLEAMVGFDSKDSTSINKKKRKLF